jgi:hypothetical protein
MSRIKIISSILLTTIFLVTQIIVVGAAPVNQDTTPITGTVESIALETDEETDITTVVVNLDTADGPQTIRLSLEDAEALGLVVDDGAGNLVPDELAVGTEVEIDPASVIPDDEGEEENEHPVGSAISNFFSDFLGVDYDTVMEYHDDGAGFGVIAQALWMTNALEGDSETFSAIMEAKQTKDFSAITLDDGSTPQNWGQFRKAVMGDRDKAKENLGAIMSGRAEAPSQQDETTDVETLDEELFTSPNPGNAPEKETGQDKEKNKDKAKGNDKEKGKDKNKDKGKGRDKNK